MKPTRRCFLEQALTCWLFLSLIALALNGSKVFAQTDLIRFAVIGDYGSAGQPEFDVANRVKSWKPDFIITVGDNNYDVGSAATIDANIGQYYHDFIFPYQGTYDPGSPDLNRFLPALGNHDWGNAYPNPGGAAPYLAYFSDLRNNPPGNGRYYEFISGAVHFFALDSDPNEPDGRASNSAQAQWLQARLAASSAVWKVVYFHHPPYSSGNHGSEVAMQWPFQAWGASVVLAGHDHTYERIIRNGFPYFVNGLGGRSLYAFGAPVAGSVVRFNAEYGAMLVTANSASMTFEFRTRHGSLIDTYTLSASSGGNPPAAPNGLTAVAVAKNRINLAWVDNANNEDGFAIERSLNGTSWSQISTVGANTTDYSSTHGFLFHNLKLRCLSQVSPSSKWSATFSKMTGRGSLTVRRSSA